VGPASPWNYHQLSDINPYFIFSLQTIPQPIPRRRSDWNHKFQFYHVQFPPSLRKRCRGQKTPIIQAKLYLSGSRRQIRTLCFYPVRRPSWDRPYNSEIADHGYTPNAFRSVSFMRVCQPGPLGLNRANTS